MVFRGATISVVFIVVLLIGTSTIASSREPHPPSFSSPSSNRPEDAIVLSSGDSVFRKLNGAGRHSYLVKVESGKCLRLLVEQKGIDVMISLKSPEGMTIKTTDRPSGSYGPESVTFISVSDSLLIVEVTAFVPDALDGGYEMRHLGLSEPSIKDRRRAEAENLTSLAEQQRSQPTKSSKESALANFEQALKIWTELDDKLEQAIVFYGLGFTEYNLSNHYSAATQFYRALKLNSELRFRYGQAINHSALGSAQYATGEHELAVYNFLQAISIYREMDNPRGLGVATHGLGTAFMLLEKYDEAMASIEESLMWRERANDNSGRLLTSLTLANLHLIKENPSAAEESLNKVKSLLGPARAAGNSEYLYFLGRTLIGVKRYGEALSTLDSALSLFEKEGNRLRYAQTRYEKSRAHFAENRMEAALYDITKATETIELLRLQTANFRSRITFTSTVEPFYEQHVRVLMALHAAVPSKRYDITAFEVAEKGRSRGLLDSLERRSLIRRGIIDPLLLEKENNLRDRLSMALDTSLPKRNEADFARIQDLSAEYSAVEAVINSQLTSPEAIQVSPLSAVEIQKRLTQDIALVSYAFAGENLFAWLVTTEQISSYVIGSSAAAERLSDRAFRCFSSAPVTAVSATCRVESTELGRLLLSPIAKTISGRRLVFIKHDSLERIPASALVNPDTGTYLVETNESTEIPSASILGMNTKEDSGPIENVAIFADPVYSFSDPRITKPTMKSQSTDSMKLPRLFASRFEAERIESLLPEGRASVNMDFLANRDTFFRLDLSRFRIIHFAAHALINDLQPESSAIVLSLFDERGIPRPGMVRPNDIQRLDLKAELVVLSACRSGIGKQIRGEGFASLAQTFFSVGARKVMFSRWEVEDKVTAETMVRFYRKLLSDKRSPSSSLRETQISLLKDRRWTHPYYWAAFTLQGNS